MRVIIGIQLNIDFATHLSLNIRLRNIQKTVSCLAKTAPYARGA